MKQWLKRIRGVVGMGLTWAAAWFGVGIMFGLVSSSPDMWVRFLVVFSPSYAVAGFIGGAAFSVVLGIAESRRTFHEMSLPRFAGWGAVVGVVLMSMLLLGFGSAC